MRNRSRAVVDILTRAPGAALASVAGLVVGLGAGPGGAAVPQARVTSGEVVVTVVGLRNARGMLRACMTDEASDFPKCDRPAHDRSEAITAADTVTLTFKDVPAGRYAIALFHDENGNGKMDRTMLFIPREGFGFSRDAKVRMGPPKFGAAAFDVVGGANEHLVIHMRYLF